MPPAAIETSQLVHRYGGRTALAGLDLRVEVGEIFALLGPNGGGKTTLFRLLSTLIPIQRGSASVLGYDVARQTDEVRLRIGVVFQAPGLDKKLTVDENLRHQGHLYGMSGTILRGRVDEMLARLGLTERRRDLVETLSGGLRRRVELAKGMLHGPRLLLLDEPSTGLDPAARGDLWDYLHRIRAEEGVTVALTTHLLEEADKADRLAILNAGSLVALDTPDRLRAEVGGDTLTIETDEAGSLAAAIADRFGLAAHEVDGSVRLELPDAAQWVPRLIEALPGRIESIRLGKPTLEDVFIARTGHRFFSDTTP
ncbi:MAG TPA: ATP-binding cassette domain-containing protein [Pirellulales bacterium]|jgi:ABC-2 type transport system ATP-binding protein|nr:ATP-binding cassette domain-containing protein [Pirellulales bacterium]